MARTRHGSALVLNYWCQEKTGIEITVERIKFVLAVFHNYFGRLDTTKSISSYKYGARRNAYPAVPPPSLWKPKRGSTMQAILPIAVGSKARSPMACSRPTRSCGVKSFQVRQNIQPSTQPRRNSVSPTAGYVIFFQTTHLTCRGS